MKITVYSVTLILMVLIFPKVSEACKCGRIAQNSEVALKNALISADLVIKGTVNSVTSTVLLTSRFGDRARLRRIRILP